jgi:hypothetical protein
MSNNRITPFVKRMRTTGGTIYTFSSSVEDIGLNINERNNVVKISHFALLNIPKINEPDNIAENRFNVLAIPSALEYNTGANIKDGRVLIAESFQNYALNLEANLINQDTYDATLQRTVSERVFWKWLKETGAVRWADPSNGYWMEALDADGSVGYNTVVKYIGQVSAGNVRSDSFGTYNETYILVPTSHGQVETYFEQVEDTNYKHGMKIGDLGENILGRESYTKPHPDGLGFQGYYDYIDSSSKVWALGPYNMTANGAPGGWYSVEGINPTDQNTYFTDSSTYLLSGDYDASIRYQDGGNVIEFRRSKVDCMSIVLDLNKLKTIYNDPNLTYDAMATGDNAINDQFEFNAVMIYYSIYNSVQDTVLATNLLGILFLDAPSGNTQLLGDGMPGIMIPSLEKIQSGVGGFGTSYSLRLNIKSDNIIDDTNATYVDNTTSSQLEAETWSEAFYQLEKAVNILTQNNSVLNYISGQYNTLQSNQTQMLKELQQLEFQVNDIAVDIKGTAGTVPLFSDGADPLIESSIYQKTGKIGFFNDNPEWPVQIDASLKTKDIYIEKSIKDVSGNNLLSYGSPIKIGSPTFAREIEIYSGNTLPSISIDTNNNVNIPALGNFIKESSLSFWPAGSFIWDGNMLDVSVSGGGGGGGISELQMKLYVDPSFAVRDLALGLTRAQYIPNVSLGSQFYWTSGLLNVTSGGSGDVTTAQMNAALALRDTSIAWLNINKQVLGNYTTVLYVNNALLPYALTASVAAGYAPITGSLNYVAKAGDTMSGSLTVNENVSAPKTGLAGGTVNLGGDHKSVSGPSSMIQSYAGITDMTGWSTTIYPKGSKIFISTHMPIYTTGTGKWMQMMIWVNINGGGWNEVAVTEAYTYSRATTVAMSKIVDVTPGVAVQVKLRWLGAWAQYYGGGDYGYGSLSVIDLY